MDRKNQKSNALLYGQVEAAIAAVFGMKPEDMKALKARLHYMRNIGVPEGLARPGSGQKIAYSRYQAFEMLLTVALERGGYTPRVAAMAGPSITTSQALFDPLKGKDLYVFLAPPEEGIAACSYCRGLDGLMKDVAQAELDSFFALNISAFARKLNEALPK